MVTIVIMIMVVSDDGGDHVSVGYGDGGSDDGGGGGDGDNGLQPWSEVEPFSLQGWGNCYAIGAHGPNKRQLWLEGNYMSQLWFFFVPDVYHTLPPPAPSPLSLSVNKCSIVV